MAGRRRRHSLHLFFCGFYVFFFSYSVAASDTAAVASECVIVLKPSHNMYINDDTVFLPSFHCLLLCFWSIRGSLSDLLICLYYWNVDVCLWATESQTSHTRTRIYPICVLNNTQLVGRNKIFTYFHNKMIIIIKTRNPRSPYIPTPTGIATIMQREFYLNMCTKTDNWM